MRGRQLGVLLALPLLFGAAFADGPAIAPALPAGAQIIETKDISAIAGKNRLLVLWLSDATKVLDTSEYCGTFVYGDHWKGTGGLSVVDPQTRKAISSIGMGTVRLPFHVEDTYYHVAHPDKAHKGKPEILHLSDLTGEGRALQFTVFDYEACGIASARVFGYRPATDQVVQYEIEVVEGKSHQREFSVNNIFSHRPIRPGYWDFRWKPGHGSDDTYHEIVRFDAKRQVFVNRHITIKGQF